MEDIELKPDGHKHAMKLFGVAIEVRLSKKQTRFMVRDIKEGIEAHYTSHDDGMPTPYNDWKSFLINDFYDIQQDMK